MSVRDHKFWKEFFDVYRRYPELWKVKSDAYKNRMLKRRAYGILLEKYREYEPDATEDVLKKKINNIRGCYRRELNKVNRSYESGCATEDIYKPTLWYFNDLNFLRDQEENQIDSEITSLEIEANFVDSEALDNSEDLEDPVAIGGDIKHLNKSYPRTRFATSTIEKPKPASKSLATEKAIADLKVICKALTQPPDEEQNEFECFGMSIASQLKKLPEKKAQESMDFIQSYLVRQRLNSVENPCFELTRNSKRMRSEISDSISQVDSQDKRLNDEIYKMSKRLKEKEMEFIEREHNERLHILNMEKRNLENRLKYDEAEHILKVQQLSTLIKE
ncbi:uncharacterized protein LOC129914238 isoform X2 [Episyrphus balteatus]|uniref:uncharacterized protein LOC129914238 isoform X2 n=1 Tax=Episyrphus balteatus TaxID=286459 RepID=UPI0024859D93|nr:uncharacterized protein LOC129914238 isoform X2 [Episyrphus balteatus]